MALSNNMNSQLMVDVAEQAVVDEVKRRVRKVIEDAVNPIIDEVVEQICKDISGQAVIEHDARTMRDFLHIAVSNKKPPITPNDD